MAITHNPIIAAAADKHYVVSKIIDSNSKSNVNYISNVREVTGSEREDEIMRMASGYHHHHHHHHYYYYITMTIIITIIIITR